LLKFHKIFRKNRTWRLLFMYKQQVVRLLIC